MEKMVKGCKCTFTQCLKQCDSGVCRQQQRSLRVSLLGTAGTTQEYYLCSHMDPWCRIGNIHCVQGQLQQNGGIQRNFVKPPESTFCKGSESPFSAGLYKSSISFQASHRKQKYNIMLFVKMCLSIGHKWIYAQSIGQELSTPV